MTAPASTTSHPQPLSDEQQAFFQKHGYVVLRGLASQQECAALLAAAQEALANAVPPLELETDVGYAGAPASREAEGGQTVRRLLDADSRGTPYTEWARDRRVAGAIAQLIGSPVHLSLAHHNCVMTKHPAFGTATHWHRDSRYWSFARNELVSSWLALVEETVDNGCLWVIPGSHTLNLPAERFDEKLFLRQDLPENRELIDTARPVPLLPGDVLLFHCNTFHAARANQTGQVKFSAVFTYYGPGNHPLPGTRSSARPDPLVG
ncbi:MULTISPECIES: phytanoyl-CoA dioxygenase family protein [Ralstonia]|uniref:Deoxyhypusine synthase n=1 Tax=Ralstonia mannitolilytica TaxID=105219 RepID=A0AAJ5D671_9RALS|nr:MULTISPECIES: phytanoyl-CoA dioxygenase family protein [Ralstonia]AJW47496.1 phytanoyl-CoA dioxygenase [Ralstonia mannitolilytica]MBU9577291.1 phytanoyl-CoA dioxygenase family protein [Ralstonia mannitolilytica]PLT18372.1 phytanoyl-CoA dioxygenase [Ralstonia mannitolilytica]CAG2130810.1 Ectoine dioxygenase [Ralstonia mannitolilytica]CAJ0731564.1 Ectoine dioxygenase [Ralstonia mannitolilytica]